MSEFVPLGEQIEIDEVLAEPTSERVISLLNEAQLYDKEGKLNCLHQVQELIIHKDPSLLDNFMDEVIAFQQDASAEVRKCVISFMEEACKKDPGSLSKVVPILQYTMSDNNVNILKRVLTCVNQLYRLILEFLLTRKSVTDEMVGMWESMKDIKNQVLDLVESSDNVGVKTQAIKFLETLILLQTKKDSEQLLDKGPEIEISLDSVIFESNGDLQGGIDFLRRSCRARQTA